MFKPTLSASVVSIKLNIAGSGPAAVLPPAATRWEYVCAPGALAIMPPSSGDVNGARCTCHWV